jgi:hypothetical protein
VALWLDAMVRGSRGRRVAPGGGGAVSAAGSAQAGCRQPSTATGVSPAASMPARAAATGSRK